MLYALIWQEKTTRRTGGFYYQEEKKKFDGKELNSYLGKKTKDVKKGNFLTYVDKSQREYGDLGKMDEQVKNSWKNMSKRLVKIKNKIVKVEVEILLFFY